MKRQPILFASALMCILGAALWGVNYRLQHPPLTAADREFRALVSGADGVTIRQKKPVGFVARGAPFRVLDAAQTRRLIDNLRFTGADENLNVASLSPLELTFARAGQPRARLELYQSQNAGALETLQKPYRVFHLHPRFAKSLRRMLNELPVHNTPR